MKKSNIQKLRSKNVNRIESNIEENVEHAQDYVNVMIQEEENMCNCAHNKHEFSKYIIGIGDTKFCSVIDTGSEVSLISEGIWLRKTIV